MEKRKEKRKGEKKKKKGRKRRKKEEKERLGSDRENGKRNRFFSQTTSPYKLNSAQRLR